MLKSNELREGNFVYDVNNEMYLKLPCVDIFMISVGSERESKYEPIKITEEILFKSGFVNWDKVDDCYIVKGLIIWKCNEMFLCYKNGVQVKYLHQLQNLYFALTNKELEINL